MNTIPHPQLLHLPGKLLPLYPEKGSRLRQPTTARSPVARRTWKVEGVLHYSAHFMLNEVTTEAKVFPIFIEL